MLAPTPELVAAANKSGDYNDCSYVLLYRIGDHKIVFAGDSHDRTWEHILANYEAAVAGTHLLIAPHHGRRSDRSWDFLDTLCPLLTFFGNAPSEHLAYSAWRQRDLWYFTNNQAGSMVVDTSRGCRSLYSTHKPFAQQWNENPDYHQVLKAYYCCDFA